VRDALAARRLLRRTESVAAVWRLDELAIGTDDHVKGCIDDGKVGRLLELDKPIRRVVVIKSSMSLCSHGVAWNRLLKPRLFIWWEGHFGTRQPFWLFI
jgi:hypothetical protein